MIFTYVAEFLYVEAKKCNQPQGIQDQVKR
jgi:hypothetical protein